MDTSPKHGLRKYRDEVFVMGAISTSPHAVMSVYEYDTANQSKLNRYVYVHDCQAENFCTLEIAQNGSIIVCNKKQSFILLMTPKGEVLSRHGVALSEATLQDVEPASLNQAILSRYQQPAHLLTSPVICGMFDDKILIADTGNFRLLLFDVDSKTFSVLDTGPISCVGAEKVENRLYVACTSAVDHSKFPGNERKYHVYENMLLLYGIE